MQQILISSDFREGVVLRQPLLSGAQRPGQMERNGARAEVAREANNGDDFSVMMLERTGKSIGTAVASMINLLSIERIILGGAIMEAGDLILKPIIEEARRRSFQPCFEATKIVAAELGADGVAIGAALLARDVVA